MQAIRSHEIKAENDPVVGGRFFSTRMTQSYREPWIANNYVFPTQPTTAGDFCSTLASLFTVGLPINWQLLDGTDIRGPGQPQNNATLALNAELNVRYGDTAFGRLESKLKNVPKLAIQGGTGASASAHRAP
jgi:hypothetical protein